MVLSYLKGILSFWAYCVYFFLIIKYISNPRRIITAVRVMSTNRAVDEEGFQAEFLKHGIRSLNTWSRNIFSNWGPARSEQLLDYHDWAHVLKAICYISTSMAIR